MKTSKQVQVIYLGEQVDIIGHINQVFRDKKGKVFKYNGVKGVWPGSCYLIDVNPDGSSTIKTRPESVEKPKIEFSEKDRLEYETNKEIAKHQRLLNKQAMDIKKPHEDITRAIQLLKPFARSVSNIDLNRFMGYLKNQLTKPTKKGRRR